jgi:hypothetical protein
MPNYGFLNDIFNLSGVQTVLLKRIEYAFGKNGEHALDFWERFFSCEKYHKNNQFIYIFTEEQLNILLEWWMIHVDYIDDNTATEKEKDIKDDLLHSMEYLKTFTDRKMVEERVLACYFNERQVTKLIPNPDTEKNGQVNFFKGEFNKNLQSGPGKLRYPNDCKRFLGGLLGNFRNRINRKFNNPFNSPENWLFYNGLDYGIHGTITYCNEYWNEKPPCPFV